MKHSFNSNRKYLLLVLGMTLCALCSCKQSKPQAQEQGVMKEELTAMLDSVKAAAKEEVKAEMQAETSSESSTQSSSEDYASSSSTSSSSSSSNQTLSEKAYKKGYDYGMEQSHVNEIDFYLNESRGGLKSHYINCVATNYSSGVGEENKTNKQLFNEFKRGFIKGYQDGNAL